MHVEKSSQGDLLELTLEGRLDNESSVYFREVIESSEREGWHRILVDLGGVSYLSSSGIAALIDAKKRLDRLDGFFGIHNAIPAVRQILSLTRLFDKLGCDPEQARASGSSSATTPGLLGGADGTAPRVAQDGDLELAIYSLKHSRPLSCRVFGDPQWLFDSRTAEPRPQSVSFGPKTFGLGLGALGKEFDSAKSSYGEFLAVVGGVAQSAHTYGGLPDYLLAAGDFVPAAQVLYGVQCEGDLPVLIRFSRSEASAQFGLSTIVASALRQTKYASAGFVILADCAGLVGAQLRQSPAKLQDNGTDRFALPGVRSWLSFSAEQIHRHNLVLIVGVAATAAFRRDEQSPLHNFLRPLEPKGELTGHFHAAVFPYRPLKKRVLPLESSVSELFDSGSIENVLHLLRDDRPITGPGESELFGGACWLGPIEETIAEEDDLSVQGGVALEDRA